MSQDKISFSDNSLIEMLALQYINGKAADSVLDYVKMYRQAKKEVEQAWAETTEPFEIDALVN